VSIPAFAIKVLSRLASPGGRGGRFTVLLYHRVLRAADPLLPAEPDAASFDAQLAALTRVFNILPLQEALDRLRDGSLPARSICITFDDGYRDNLEVALPILRRHGIVATFFIATGFLDGGRMMHDSVIETVRRLTPGAYDLEWLGLGQRQIDDMASRAALIGDIVGVVKYLPFAERRDTCERFAALSPTPLPSDLMMTSGHLQELANAGMHIGAHTHDHPILSNLDADTACQQITRNVEALTRLIGKVPRLFAYPNGKPLLDYGTEHVEIVRRAGFDAAVSVSFGTVSRDSDHFQIPRFAPWDRDPERLAFRVALHPLRHRVAVQA
jgi:peptidoglycan/xylan/chitin deacetylase (PgdA/CDA1 family)